MYMHCDHLQYKTISTFSCPKGWSYNPGNTVLHQQQKMINSQSSLNEASPTEGPTKHYTTHIGVGTEGAGTGGAVPPNTLGC